ncbi:MAG TPA: hypothetical protein VFM46_06400, partial [Pseudomonadales bacterium]|nr:hypothetical protein [Pseudomonadales bacterium]
GSCVMRQLHLVRIVLACSILLFSHLVHADDSKAAAAKALNELHSLGLNLQKTVMLYFMLQGEDGDPRIASQVDQGAKTVDLTWQSLKGTLNQLGVTGPLANIDQTLSGFQSNLKSCRAALQKNGFDEPAVTEQMKHQERDLQQMLNDTAQKVKDATQYKIQPDVASLRALALLMQQMTSRYVEKASANNGSAYRDTSSETELDQLAQYFRKKLEEVQNSTQQNEAVRNILRNVSVRWNFMEGSFVHYNEDTVPFLIARYSDDVIQQLNQAANTLDNK